MKLYWQNLTVEDGEGIIANLLTEPAAKLAQIERQRGVLYFKCLGQFIKMNIATLEEAKRLAEVKFRTILLNILDTLRKGDVPDEQAPVANARSAR